MRVGAHWRPALLPYHAAIAAPSRRPREADYARRAARRLCQAEWRTPFVPRNYSHARPPIHSEPSERLEETAAQGGALRVRRLAAPEAERAACAPWRPAARPCLLPPPAEASCTQADARRGEGTTGGDRIGQRPCCMPRICVPYASEVVSPAARQLTGVRARCHSSREARARRWRPAPVISPAVLPARVLDEVPFAVEARFIFHPAQQPWSSTLSAPSSFRRPRRSGTACA